MMCKLSARSARASVQKRFYASAAAALSVACRARDAAVGSVANLAASLAAGAMRDACAQVQATLHAQEALAAAAHAQAARKKRRARADPTADAAAAAAAAAAKRALAHLAAQCALDAAAACSAALFPSTSLARVRVWGFRRQDAARLLARETKLAMVSSRGARFGCALNSSQSSCILCVLGLIRGSLPLSLFLFYIF
jgi:hypothetical protein